MSLGTMTKPASASMPMRTTGTASSSRLPAGGGSSGSWGDGGDSGGGGGEVGDGWLSGILTKATSGPTPSTAPPLNPYGSTGNPYAGGWQNGRKVVADPWYQWQKASDALANAQYDQDMNALLRERAMLEARGRGGGGNRAAYNAAMQALEADRVRLGADQALSAEQQRLALWNRDLTNRAQRGSLMSDAVARGADTSAGVAQNYTDITDRNQLNYEQSMAQAKRNDAYLTQLSKDYGVKESQIKAALTRGAAAYGMSYANAMAQIDDAMNSLDMNRKAAALQAQMMILQAGGTLPTAPTHGVYPTTPAKPSSAGGNRFS